MMVNQLKIIGFMLILLLYSSSQAQVRVILDTDMDSDVDDVQALAMLHAYEQAGLIDLIGVVVTSNDSSSFACADAINTFYGKPDIPIGFLKEQDDLSHFSKYTRQVSKEFPHSLKQIGQTTESARLYRKLLAESPDTSVVIVTIGHLSSLQDLLQSVPDSMSPLSGQQLVRQKVKRWLCMGGTFPQGKEANFYRPDPLSTVYCLEHWDQEVVFCGWEVGKQIITGGDYLKSKLPQKNPVYQAYELYNNFAGRPAWDQVAVVLLDEKAEDYFDFVRQGYVAVSADGSNVWTGKVPSGKNHAYVRIKDGVAPDSIARYMDDLVVSLSSLDSSFFIRSLTHVQDGLYTIAFENLSMTIDARLGARIVGFALKDDQILTVEDKDLLNFGSTFWSAPQSQWGWPPYEALHTGKYRAAFVADSLVFTGGVDEKSSFQAVKTISLDRQAKAFRIKYTLVNHKDTATKVGPWEVTAVPAGGLTFFRENKEKGVMPKSNLSFSDTLGMRYLYYPSDKVEGKQKLFAFTQGGWLAHVTADRQVFVKNFEPTPPDKVAPGQGEVEVYIDPQAGYMELENHGTYRQLQPGEGVDYRVTWFLRELPESIPADHVTQALVDFVEIVAQE